MATEKRLIPYGDAVRFLRDSKVPETGAFSKGINKGLNIALSALGNEEIFPHVDAVEVVRCKDCMYYVPLQGTYVCECCEGLNFASDNDFCSCGERRTDGR